MRNQGGLLHLSIAELAQAFRSGAASPVELADASLAQLERLEASLNAFVVREEAAEVRRQAAASAARWRSGQPCGPLDGIPMTVKDAVAVKGWPMRVGSMTTPAGACDFDAPAVARVREAGAILIGKTTTPEFGWKAVTDSPLTGISRNPWNPELTPGGSSGGAAAAVAAGMATASIGTDAGGSVRIPGSFCGLVALKATRGRIPAYPPSAVWTAGHIGPIARSVSDVALLLQVMAQPDARDWNGLPPLSEDPVAAVDGIPDISGARIAYSPTLGHARVDPEVADRVRRAVDRLSRLGARVDEISAPLPDARDAFRIYFHTGLSHAMRHLTAEQRGVLDQGFARVVDEGQRISRAQFLEAYEFQIRISREARLLGERFDLLVTPTMAVPPFQAGVLSPPGYDPENWLEWSPFTYPFNLTGQPALTLCCGYTDGGLPIGLQIVGRMHEEAALLRAARAFEASAPFELKRAPCFPE